MAEWVLRQRFASDEGEIAWDRLGDGPALARARSGIAAC
jgi:hypothetical protein